MEASKPLPATPQGRAGFPSRTLPPPRPASP
jgi:hypothetical protein